VSSAVDVAARALARRDRSETDVRRILARKGVSDVEAEEALERLRGLGALDDARFAAGRATGLAERGYGDAGIAARLARDGVEREHVDAAIGALAPERDRAAALVARRGVTLRTARWLAGRGFSSDSIESAVPGIAETRASELG
jgi:SOS response regulatory protein OraA/RecX